MSIIIYKIYDDLDCYVGSTSQNLSNRLNEHKTPCNNCLSKIIIARNNYKIKIIEEVNEDDRYDRELYYIKELSTLKQKKPPLKLESRRQNKLEMGKIYNTKYYEQNKEEEKKRKLNHYHENKEKLNEKFTCECGGRYTKQHLALHNKTQKHLKFMNNEE